MSGKRSYAVPVLLVLLTCMTVLVVLLYSKVLIAGQNRSTEEGKQLADRYAHALMFADYLHDGADLLLKDTGIAERLRAKKWLGQALIAGGPAAVIFSEADHRSSGRPLKEALSSVMEAVNLTMSQPGARFDRVAEHDGPLTAEEKDMLLIVRDGAANMQKALSGFRPPTGDAGFRRMAAGEQWVQPALAAGQALQEMAAKLK